MPTITELHGFAQETAETHYWMVTYYNSKFKEYDFPGMDEPTIFKDINIAIESIVAKSNGVGVSTRLSCPSHTKQGYPIAVIYAIGERCGYPIAKISPVLAGVRPVYHIPAVNFTLVHSAPG